MPENARTTRFQINVWAQFHARTNTASSAFTFYIFGVFHGYIPPLFNAVFCTLRHYLFHLIRLHLISSFNQSIVFIIPVLISFLQLKYLGNDQNDTPFATHPTTMRVAVSSSVVYYISYIGLLRFRLGRFAIAVYYCLVWSGYTSIGSLASILLPSRVSPFIYALFALLSAGELLYYLYNKVVGEDEGADFQVYRRRFDRFLNNIWRIVSNSFEQRPRILPI